MNKFLFNSFIVLFVFFPFFQLDAQTVCTGDPRLNLTDAQNCANIAQTQGSLHGLNVSCSTSMATYPTTDPQAGPGYYFNIPCTVNNNAGYDAVLLAGYNGSSLTTPNLNPLWWMFSGTPSVATTTNNTGTSITDSYLADSERERVQAVYNMYMANGGVLLRQTALYYLYTNPGITSANSYFQVAYFGSGSNNLMNRSDFKDQVERVNRFWADILSRFPNREIQLEGSGAPLGGSPDRLNQIVWVDAKTLTYRIGTQTGSNNTSTSSTSGTGTSNYINNAGQLITYINNLTGNSNYTLPPVFQAPTTNTTNTNQNLSNINTYCGIMTDLRLGDSGQNVTTLTMELVREGLLSNSKNNFDTEVFNAVIAYQEKYKSSILTPVGLTRGTGFVGLSTRNFMNSRISCSGSTINNNNNSSTNAATLQAQIRELQLMVQNLLDKLAQMGANQ